MNLHGAFAVSGDMMKHNVLVGLLAIGLVGGIISCDDDASTGGEVTDQDGGSDVGTGGAMDLDSTVATGDATPTPPIPDAATLGDFNDPCEAARDCLTGICVNGPDGSRVCSRRCADDCPDPWECRAVDNAGPDVQFICVAFTDTLCDPCEEDSECGRTANLCVPVGTGTYCGRDCADDPEGCPEGYTCEEITGEDGEVRGSQCVPESNACTPCEDADNDGYGDGDACDGLDCNDADPSVYAGAPELCDNQDNDCDQRSDEDIAEQPGIECLSDGACEGTTPECAGGEWQCTYGGEYEAESEATCDRIDNDCDGNVDEDFDLEVDPMNCGNCGTVCEYPNAVGECVEFRCGIGDCVAGWWDANQNPDDGCEYACVQSNEGEEICDGRDNDCDNQIDEGFDLQVDVSHCGACNRACAYDNAAPLCVEGECALGDCEDTWWDADGDAANGCEYRCIPSREGVEACDDIDNDCDNRIDEDWDFSQDTRNCGGCGIVCEFPRAVPACFGGVCGLAVCEPGWVDLDMDPSNGCELECAETNDGIETCDEADNDCDGRTDEAFDLQNDLANCGACGNVCDVANATDACIAGECRPLECDPGFWDIDQDPENGCEYACEISNEGEELCDEVDNDCDGEVDEDYDLLNDSSNCAECGNICAYPMAVGVCIEGECQQAACEAGFFDLNDDSADGCEYGPCALTNDGLEACDVIDNDCDGTIDEGFDTNIDLLHCGQCRSVCAPENAEPACVAGECRILDCDAGFVDLDGRVGTGCEYECSPSNDGVEACDDIDNDCDGNVDETFDTDTDVENCGVCGRACAYDNGVAACDAGECSFVECRPTYYDVNRNPQADGCEYGPCIITQDGNEVCDGIDNDCDGAVDEALTRDCGTDVGACRQGTQTCDAGDWGACVGEITDEPETCDNRDNDCDGNTDESLERDCGDPTGECTLGFETCDAGEWGECLPREPEDQLLPEREVCDNRDNDCDGNVDEAVTRSCGVGVGECQTGTETCDAGQWGECVDAQEPQEETCDNRDNDCDDIIDEGVTRVCGTDEGRCETGTETCDAGQWGACEDQVVARDETCNNVDDDCDGVVDELVTRLCGTNVGECEFGTETCDAGQWGACIGATDPVDEFCDNRDNNCDGNIDENVTRVCGDDTGRCETGIETCAAGQWGACDGEIVPRGETCNDIDDDCDGNTDEMVTRVCGSDTGICQRGVETCADGQWGVCAGEVGPEPNETCNGEDDDCDGNTDEGFDAIADLPDINRVDSNCDGIDGDRDLAVFVSPSGDDDANSGLTAGSPVRSLAEAFSVAVANNRTQILLENGVYTSGTTLVPPGGVGVYGGYSNDFTTRNATRPSINSTASVGLRVDNLVEPLLFDQVDISVTNRGNAGEAAVVFQVRNSGANLTVARSTVEAGRGGPGDAGRAGDPGNAGRNGGNAIGTGGGTGPGNGGAGGNGRRTADGNPGQAGSPGTNNVCGGNGGGGGDDTECADGDPTSGGNAGGGCNGTTGSSGSPGGALGALNGITWSRVDGTPGNTGGQGGGGGGGGAGGGEDCQACAFGSCTCIFCGTGRGGGGGGEGGFGGQGGRGGMSGGALIGFVIQNATVNLVDTTVTTGGGGAGGGGGARGTGGAGGARGLGARNDSNTDGDGGNGGTGGRGGNGGCGGGGAGGPSLGAWGSQNATITRTGNVEFNAGGGGNGGSGASGCGAVSGPGGYACRWLAVSVAGDGFAPCGL